MSVRQGLETVQKWNNSLQVNDFEKDMNQTQKDKFFADNQ